MSWITPREQRPREESGGGLGGFSRVTRKRDGDLSALSMTDLMALRDRVDAEIDTRREEDQRSLLERGGLVERDGPRYRNPFIIGGSPRRPGNPCKSSVL